MSLVEQIVEEEEFDENNDGQDSEAIAEARSDFESVDEEKTSSCVRNKRSSRLSSHRNSLPSSASNSPSTSQRRARRISCQSGSLKSSSEASSGDEAEEYSDSNGDEQSSRSDCNSGSVNNENHRPARGKKRHSVDSHTSRRREEESDDSEHQSGSSRSQSEVYEDAAEVICSPFESSPDVEGRVGGDEASGSSDEAPSVSPQRTRSSSLPLLPTSSTKGSAAAVETPKPRVNSQGDPQCSLFSSSASPCSSTGNLESPSRGSDVYHSPSSDRRVSPSQFSDDSPPCRSQNFPSTASCHRPESLYPSYPTPLHSALSGDGLRDRVAASDRDRSRKIVSEISERHRRHPIQPIELSDLSAYRRPSFIDSSLKRCDSSPARETRTGVDLLDINQHRLLQSQRVRRPSVANDVQTGEIDASESFMYSNALLGYLKKEARLEEAYVYPREIREQPKGTGGEDL